MEILGMLLMGLGGITALVGSVWLLIEEFKTSIVWGLGCIFVPFVSLIWLVMHFDRGATPFFISLGGSLVCLLGVVLGGADISVMS